MISPRLIKLSASLAKLRPIYQSSASASERTKGQARLIDWQINQPLDWTHRQLAGARDHRKCARQLPAELVLQAREIRSSRRSIVLALIRAAQDAIALPSSFGRAICLSGLSESPSSPTQLAQLRCRSRELGAERISMQAGSRKVAKGQLAPTSTRYFESPPPSRR